ncbi:SRPBCC family protein [Herbidospora daliensis]|uniref:SRPBCC family protein n=1 Tax=Herbidospora daliensis TaxID=295585 RepID=UPI00078181A4|nr:SRPBCC family protein [Herbidospora daliensis]
MPYSYGVTAHSQAPPDAVFAALVHAATWPRWSPIDSADVENGDPGDTWTFPSSRNVSRKRIVALIDDRRLPRRPFRSYRGTVDLSPAPGGGTPITWSATFWTWYLTRFMQRMVDGLAAYPDHPRHEKDTR